MRSWSLKREIEAQGLFTALAGQEVPQQPGPGGGEREGNWEVHEVAPSWYSQVGCAWIFLMKQSLSQLGLIGHSYSVYSGLKDNSEGPHDCG